MKKRCGDANVPVSLHEAAQCANGLGLEATPGLPAGETRCPTGYKENGGDSEMFQ